MIVDASIALLLTCTLISVCEQFSESDQTHSHYISENLSGEVDELAHIFPTLVAGWWTPTVPRSQVINDSGDLLNGVSSLTLTSHSGLQRERSLYVEPGLKCNFVGLKSTQPNDSQRLPIPWSWFISDRIARL